MDLSHMDDGDINQERWENIALESEEKTTISRISIQILKCIL